MPPTARDLAFRQLLRCPLCGLDLALAEDQARCRDHVFRTTSGVLRLTVPAPSGGASPARTGLSVRTSRSFGYEWTHFDVQRPEYRANFDWYVQPLGGMDLDGHVVLDAGCGMGRHTHYFLEEGARVVALDASSAIDVAARNNAGAEALFVQADILHLPLRPDSFDLVCCLGVLHHLEATERALSALVRVAKPGGWVLVYVYHDLWEKAAWKGALVTLVSAARVITTRLPHRVLSLVAWLLSAVLYVGYVGPLKALSRVPRMARALAGLPLGQYVEYPFGVLWNDQFDRLSAPLEKRFRRAEVEALLHDAGLTDLRVLGGFGWRAAGRRPMADHGERS